MTIILRLQGLDLKASIADIRTFFDCLHIPDGGVYIVGGSLKEAFIAFTTERDAQLAMRLTGNVLKGSKVTLHISSMKEMEHKLKSLLKKKHSAKQHTVKKSIPSPDASLQPLNAWPHTNTANQPPTNAWELDPKTANPPQPHNPDISNLQLSTAESLDASTAFLLGICTVLQGIQSHQRENNEAVPRVDFPKTDDTVVVSEDVRATEQTLNSGPGYVRLFGLPATVTKAVICHFFKGLTVQEAIVNVKLGLNHGCLVKFANARDAHNALLFNQQSLGPLCVEVRGATEKMWTSALQECENAADVGEGVKAKQRFLGEMANQKRKSAAALWIRRRPVDRFPSKLQKKPRPAFSQTMEYTVMVTNLPEMMTKTEIKDLFRCPNIAHRNVLHLLDNEGNRTNTAFLLFNCTEDYDYAMNLTGCHVGSDAIKVSSITKAKMRDMMNKTYPRSLKDGLKMDRKKKPDRKRKLYPVEAGRSTMHEPWA